MTNEILFSQETDISEDWVDFIEAQALTLSEKDDFNIENYVDSEIQSPLVASFLDRNDLDDSFDEEENEVFTLNLKAKEAFRSIPRKRRRRFANLKRKVREMFCRLAPIIPELDLKEIIRKILIGLLPVFATGIPFIIIPVIIGIVASFIAKGVSVVCPN